MNDIRNGINRRRLLRGAGAAAGMIGVGSLGVPARVEARASSSSASGNLVILHSSDDQPYLEYLKANFAKDFPNVTVEIQGVGYDQLYTKESTVLASGSDSIDILAMDPVWTADFAKNGWSTPLDEFLTADERAQFKPGFLDPFTSDGKIVGLPFGINFKTMFYNTDTAKALGLSGPPGTYEELAEIGAGLKGKNSAEIRPGLRLGSGRRTDLRLDPDPVCVRRQVLRQWQVGVQQRRGRRGPDLYGQQSQGERLRPSVDHL